MYKKLFENVTFSFGKGAGKEIFQALNQANQSIFILTPYISKTYVDFLLRKKQEGIQISLITNSDADSMGMEAIFRKIIFQQQSTNREKLAHKNQLKNKCFLITKGIILLEFLLLVWHSLACPFHSIYQLIKNFFIDDFIFILIGIIGLLIIRFFYKKFHEIRIFDYSYSTRFYFSVLPSNHFNDTQKKNFPTATFTHAKIYIIDKKDIFIGSANLTHNGLKNNIESFVKISNPENVKEMIDGINTHLKSHCFPIPISILGSRVYHEPPY